MTISDSKLVVRSGDEIIVCVGSPGRYSIQSDNPELVKEVKKHLSDRSAVPLLPNRLNLRFVADESSYIGILAAMFAPNPGRSLLLVAPDSLLFELREYSNKGIGFIL